MFKLTDIEQKSSIKSTGYNKDVEVTGEEAAGMLPSFSTNSKTTLYVQDAITFLQSVLVNFGNIPFLIEDSVDYYSADMFVDSILPGYDATYERVLRHLHGRDKDYVLPENVVIIC